MKKPISICITLFITANTLIPQISCSQNKSEKVLIGARQFVITTMEKGKPETGVQEQLIFTDSTFDNLQCHQYGFKEAEYSANKSGNNYNFEATMLSDTEGKMIWKGTITGDTVKGEMIWRKQGQDDIQYEFKGNAGMLAEKKTISLDGKIFATNTMVQNKPETAYDEDWTFDGGTLRSPSCEAYGFFKSPYKAWEQNGVITMESVFTSEKEGYMNFTATIKGDNLNGNVVWYKKGQDNITYDVTGTLKK